MPLRRLRDPFDDPEWLFELKYDGFRALAFVRERGPEFVSRNGNRFGQFAALAAEPRVRSAVLGVTYALAGAPARRRPGADA